MLVILNTRVYMACLTGSEPNYPAVCIHCRCVLYLHKLGGGNADCIKVLLKEVQLGHTAPS